MRTKRLAAGDIAEAAELLKRGEIVAIPTETVYGLAASALDETAVGRIFEAKGRPSDNPLIVHIAEPGQVYGLAADVPPAAEKLIKAFWPGALTLVFNAAPLVPHIVTAGLPTVAVRCPDHPVARSILTAAGVPLAAPSANRSGFPSPTRACHVLDDMDGVIAAVVDGGDCRIGVESTVLDVTSVPPRVLRLGGVSKEALERVLGVELPVSLHAGADGTPRSPGQKYRHYAPRAPLTVIHASPDGRTDASPPPGAPVLCPEEYSDIFANAVVYGRLSEPESLARGLFAALREADAKKPAAIAAVCPRGGQYDAVRDRLARAAADMPGGGLLPQRSGL